MIVQGAADLRLMVPCWMLDQDYCRSLVSEQKPRIAVEALVGLRTLIDGQGMCAGGKDAGYDSIMVNRNHHEKKKKKCEAPGDDCTPSKP